MQGTLVYIDIVCGTKKHEQAETNKREKKEDPDMCPLGKFKIKDFSLSSRQSNTSCLFDNLF